MNEPKTTNDGGSVEVVRRPRGRPPGTRNKPKSSVHVAPEPDPSMSPYLLEIAGGSDIIAALRQFCNHHNTSLCVISGSGAVSAVSFRLPSAAATASVFQGCFTLMSISATIIPSSSPVSTIITPPSTSTSNDFLSKFVVSIASPQGQMFGGVVVGPLIASGTVYIVAVPLNNPLYHQIAKEDDDIRGFAYGYVPVPVSQSLCSIVGGDSTEQHHAAHPQVAAVEPLSIMYGSHLPADFGWPSTPRRQNPPHSSPYN